MHIPKPFPPIDWDKVGARGRLIIPDPAVAIDIVRVVRDNFERMADWEWTGIADPQQLAEDMAQTLATGRLTDRIKSQHLQSYIYAKTHNYPSVAEITDAVIQDLARMSPRDWEDVGPDRKAHLVEAINAAIEAWMDQESQRRAPSVDAIKQVLAHKWWSRKDKANRVWQDLLDTLNSLPPVVRSTVALRKLRGHSVEEISEILKISPQQVKRYLAIAADGFSSRQE